LDLLTIIESARGLLPGQKKQKAPPLRREQALSARPVRNPSLKWRVNDDGEAIIVLPRRKDVTGKFLAWMFFVPETRPLALDEVGTFVWQNCDGTSSIAELSEKLSKEYRLGRKEAELSLTEFLKMLAKRGMIGFLVPDELAAELGEEHKKLLGLEHVGNTEADLRKAEKSAAEEQQDATDNPAQDRPARGDQ